MMHTAIKYGNCNAVIQRGCPIETILRALGGKWKGIIISALYHEPHFYNALHRDIPGISRKTLTEQLNDLISLQIVQREEMDDYQNKVKYALTPKGKTIYPMIQEMTQIINTSS
ncbi:winged helix-turn-helix transcriptional regulator [Staphylococcus edaphicus]|uniref:Helix-turn-helix transcriptional regulator n=2 Tax=Staphylococcus edaphicus TaxID=1955013 RepID=A0ABY4QB54_9STAP|nr:helix-turn-helix domain-containing protein [Staphylococcus edaphicus]UQW81607.1 helix-turn-helix transcriptional regulator [Staphylococcus edaphicus]